MISLSSAQLSRTAHRATAQMAHPTTMPPLPSLRPNKAGDAMTTTSAHTHALRIAPPTRVLVRQGIVVLHVTLLEALRIRIVPVSSPHHS
jgi:hypothetical protein